MSEEKPKCPECGGSGRVPKPMTKPPHPCNYVNILRSEETMPCPACQPKEPKPEAGEFVKELRDWAKYRADTPEEKAICIKAADRIEQLVKTNLELCEELKGKVEALMRFHNKKFGFEERIEQLQEKLYFAELRIKRDKIASEQLKEAK